MTNYYDTDLLLLGFICFFYFYSLYIVNVVSKHVYIILTETKKKERLNKSANCFEIS